RHPWVALRDRAGWERWEVMCCPDGSSLDTVQRSERSPLSDAGGGGGKRAGHGVFRDEEARRMIACVRREAPRYPYRHSYAAWPGPNSNTFVDWLLERCSIPVSLPPASIRKA